MSERKRSKKDEDDYNDTLRREEPIKTEVIVELRHLNQILLTNQQLLLEALIQSSDHLRTYRVQALERTKYALKSTSHCVVGCTNHTWDDVDGWHRT